MRATGAAGILRELVDGEHLLRLLLQVVLKPLALLLVPILSGRRLDDPLASVDEAARGLKNSDRRARHGQRDRTHHAVCQPCT